jgi:hypothetical protein
MVLQTVVQSTTQGYYCNSRKSLIEQDTPIVKTVLASYTLLIKSTKAKPTVIIRPMYLA